MIGRLRRWRARRELERIDAEVAQWFVLDGTLSLRPLDGPLAGERARLRGARLRAVGRLERAGGRDPWPAVLREPSEAQRSARPTRSRGNGTAFECGHPAPSSFLLFGSTGWCEPCGRYCRVAAVQDP